MTLRTFRYFVVSCIVLLSAEVAIAIEWDGTLTDEAYNAFIAQYRTDPDAVQKNRNIFRKMSSRQLHGIPEALGTTHFTYMYPVVIKGEEISDLLGKNFEFLSLMAVKGGRFVPVPYQFDEYDATGLIYIPDISPHKPDGQAGVLDKTDELVFMFRDAGMVPYDETSMTLTEGSILKMIKLEPPEHDPRYIYIVEGNSRRSEADYVTADMGKTLSIVTARWKVVANPENSIEVMELSSQYGPSCGQNFLDTYNIKMSTGFLSEHLRFELNSQDNIHSIILGVKEGPVRETLLFKLRIWYFGMPTLYTEYFNARYYEQAMNIPSRFNMDTLSSLRYFLKFIKRPQIQATFDLHNVEGAGFITQNAFNPDEHGNMGIVDNHMSPIENKIVTSRLPGEWFFFDSNKGWTIFFSNQLHIAPGGLIDEYMAGMQVQMLYKDDLQYTWKYEKFPGAAPLIGFSMEGFPKKAIDMLACLKNMDFSKIDTFGELVSELDRIGKEGDLKAIDKITNRIIVEMKKKKKITSKEDLINIVLEDIKIFNIRGIPRETLADLVERAMESEINEEMNNFNHYKLVHKLIELAEADGIDLNDLHYKVADSTIWFPDALDNDDPRYFNRQIKNPPKVTILPYHRMGISQK